MIQGGSYRGQPLVAFLLIVGGWVAMRLMVWDAGMAGAGIVPPDLAIPAEVAAPAAIVSTVAPPDATLVSEIEAAIAPRHAGDHAARSGSAGRMLASGSTAQASRGYQEVGLPLLPTSERQVLRLAQPNAAMPFAAASGRSAADARWSADGWLLARSGGVALLPGGLAPPGYGASQMGAVLRYRLATHSGYRPTLYLRGSAALNGTREREAAFGLSARPLAALPVAFAAEARVNAQPGRTRLRPAALAYTELPPIDLPLRTRAELYGQAGYVGGNFASAFADGQARLERRIAAIGPGELRAGGGAWGGAQKGAARFDLGPTATLAMPLGKSAGARVGVDWRIRVAGNAAPTSGPALTLSAGF